ncbi:hypothetical protein [Flavivirga algicola]|uniref:Uncharacterized protein n=1 Tax=Flavivirga algicola TaxID=2729136 RepID=A0ABX1RT85_9FLAO|nr:hypothetical protein [Flavivirga algicola]NMH86288.1 hypothetical protein [Flavivirga algicola]
MKTKIVIILFLTLVGFSFKTIKKGTITIQKTPIEWVNNLKGDFSFKKKWSYPEFIYKNRFGQLSCDGDCPAEVDLMKDESGKIYKDSLQVFYKIVDTTHIFHSLKSESNLYEYAGTNFIEFETLENGIIKGESSNNVSTHSSLVLEFQNDSCSAWIDFNSIRHSTKHILPLEKGTIKIDKILFNKGIIKAVFDFKFKNTLESDKTLFWKGQIYDEIDIE